MSPKVTRLGRSPVARDGMSLPASQHLLSPSLASPPLASLLTLGCGPALGGGGRWLSQIPAAPVGPQDPALSLNLAKSGGLLGTVSQQVGV